MKAWLKGGLIGGILGVLYFIICILIENYLPAISIWHKILVIPVFPALIILTYIFFWTSLQNYLNWIVTIGVFIQYFIIGAIIGLIVSKIKNRNQSLPKNN